MMALNILDADIGGPWRVQGSACVSGQSAIRPISHRAIETLLIFAQDATLVVVREAPLGQSRAVVTPARVDTKASVLVQEHLSWPLNIQIVILAADGSSVSVTTGEAATAPLFLTAESRSLHANWDVAELYGVIPWEVDFDLAAYALAHLGLPYSRRTIFPKVQHLTERATASWQAGADRVYITYPPPVPQPGARLLSADADVCGSFERLFGSFIRRSVPEPTDLVATELSGGLDSAVATIITCKTLGRDNVRSYGLLLPGRGLSAQKDRRNEVADMLGIRDRTHATKAPFSLGDRSDIDPAIPWGEYYSEAFFDLGTAASGGGCPIVVRGLGGDEISELSAAEYERLQTKPVFACDETPPSFLTEDARRSCLKAREALDPAPPGLVARSFYQASAASSYVYLRRGVWPVYPYACSDIIRFCLSLPFEWRSDRQLQREYLRRQGLSEEVVKPSEPESFLPVRDMMFSQPTADRVRDLFDNPLLAELGLVDARRLRDTFETSVIANGRSTDDNSSTRTHLLEAAATETMLRTWKSASKPLSARAVPASPGLLENAPAIPSFT